ncbi:MAG: hypothetical protein JST30_00460 [Armatimonadetes bacterium]|nr:hypothetical protein [Armatimonadota bacterium]
MDLPNWAVRASAFLQRGIRRSMEPESSRPGERLAERARHTLSLLDKGQSDIAAAIAMENLACESDLFFDEAALIPECLSLQVRVMKDAVRDPAAARAVDSALNEAPVSRLMIQIVSMLCTPPTEAVRIVFSDPIAVHVSQGGPWRDELTIPTDLSRPLAGTVARMEAAGFPLVKSLTRTECALPDDVEFVRMSATIVELRAARP